MKLDYKKLSKAFNSNVLINIADGDLTYILELIEDFFPNQKEELSLRNFYEESFKILSRNYANEYVFKNHITNKILRGRHSWNTATMLSEFRIGKNKADCVIMNGKSICYEIKTDYDSLVRLEDQLKSYQQLFDEVFVVCSKRYEDIVLQGTESHIGVMSLTSRNTFKILREASTRKDSINRRFLIESMRQKEYKKLAEELTGESILLPNMLMYEKCASIVDLFQDENELNHKYIQILKKSRKNNGIFIDQLPNCLANAVISYKFSKQQLNMLIKYFNDTGSIKCIIQSLEESKMNF